MTTISALATEVTQSVQIDGENVYDIVDDKELMQLSEKQQIMMKCQFSFFAVLSAIPFLKK